MNDSMNEQRNNQSLVDHGESMHGGLPNCMPVAISFVESIYIVIARPPKKGIQQMLIICHKLRSLTFLTDDFEIFVDHPNKRFNTTK